VATCFDCKRSASGR